MSLFSKTNKLYNENKDFGALGKAEYDYGKGLTDEGLTGLRGDLKLFDDRLRNPLGNEVEGIFRRASGQIADDSVRQQRGFGANLAERARQSGGTLSPAAIAELQQQMQRGLSESQFKSEFDLASEHASLTLTESNKLFDRRDAIRKTILGIGEADKDRGTSTWLASLGRRERDIQSRRNMIMGLFGGFMGAASGGTSGGGGNPGG